MQGFSHSGERRRLLDDDQELAVVGMVIANKAIRPQKIQTRIIKENYVFQNVDSISLSRTDRTLPKHRVRMKQSFKKNKKL